MAFEVKVKEATAVSPFTKQLENRKPMQLSNVHIKQKLDMAEERRKVRSTSTTPTRSCYAFDISFVAVLLKCFFQPSLSVVFFTNVLLITAHACISYGLVSVMWPTHRTRSWEIEVIGLFFNMAGVGLGCNSTLT